MFIKINTIFHLLFKIGIIILFFLFFVLGVQDVVLSEEPAANSNNKETQKESGFVPFALPYYMPETSWGLGFYLLYYKNQPGTIKGTNPDEVALYGTYTIKDQISIGISTDQYFYINIYKTTAAIEFSRFPDIFWGIGPKTKENDNENFTSQLFHIKGNFLINLGSNLYIGPAYDFKYDSMKKVEKNEQLDAGNIKGSNGVIISSIGANINRDLRNSVFYPTKGFYIDLTGFINQQAWGNDYNFIQLQSDFRYFYQIYGQHVLAFQYISDFTYGDVPMQAMYRLGGDMLMRGYYQGRYRDKNFYGIQIEHRFPIYWRFCGNLFASMGQVASTVPDLFFKNELKIAFGFGIRFIADESEHIPVRLDIGFDRELNPNAYLIVKEAF